MPNGALGSGVTIELSGLILTPPDIGRFWSYLRDDSTNTSHISIIMMATNTINNGGENDDNNEDDDDDENNEDEGEDDQCDVPCG